MKQFASRCCGNIRSCHTLTTALWLALCGALLPAARPALAQDEKLPTGEEVLDQYVEAIGGKEAYAKIKNRVETGSFEIAGQPMKGSLGAYRARPNYIYSVVEIPNVMRQERGTDGRIVWERNSRSGARLLEDPERAQFIREAVFDGEVNWRKIYKKAETVGVEDVDGAPAYKVELTIDDEHKITAFYDKKSHLFVKSSVMTKTPMGEVPVETYFGDYKKVGGILFPYTQRQVLMGMEQVLTFDSIKVNVEIPKDRFEFPPEIKEVLKHQDKTDEAPEKEEPTP